MVEKWNINGISLLQIITALFSHFDTFQMRNFQFRLWANLYMRLMTSNKQEITLNGRYFIQIWIFNAQDLLFLVFTTQEEYGENWTVTIFCTTYYDEVCNYQLL